MKSGYKTSEFWLSAAGSLLAILGAAGVIGPQDLSGLTEAVKALVLGVVGLATLVAYVAGRVKLKSLK